MFTVYTRLAEIYICLFLIVPCIETLLSVTHHPLCLWMKRSLFFVCVISV